MQLRVRRRRNPPVKEVGVNLALPLASQRGLQTIQKDHGFVFLFLPYRAFCWFSAALVAFSLSGCGGGKSAEGAAGKPASGAAAGNAGTSKLGSKKFSVRVQPVGSRSVQYTIEAVGNLVEENRFEIPARTAGVAQNVFFSEGDTMTTGQELCRIDYDRYKLLADQATANSDQQEAAVRTADAELADAVRESSTTVEKTRLDLQLAKSEFERRTAQGTSSVSYTHLTLPTIYSV